MSDNGNKVDTIFFHIGLMKTGTTTIQEYLSHDERINLILKRKFFNSNQFFFGEYNYLKKDKVNIESDEQLFTVNNYYSGSTLTLERIKNKFPNAKIILTIREQKSLLISAYKHTIRTTGNYYTSFDEFLNSKEGNIYLYMCNFNHIFDQINEYFPKENIHILLYEDLKKNYKLFFRNLYSILNIKEPGKELSINSNKSWPDAVLRIKLFLNKMLIFKQGRRIIEVDKSYFNKKDEFKLFYKIEQLMHKLILKLGMFIVYRVPRLNNYKSTAFRWNDEPLFLNLEKYFTETNQSFSETTGYNLKKYGYL